MKCLIDIIPRLVLFSFMENSVNKMSTLISGIKKEYWNNGNLWMEGPHINNVRCGPQIVYYPNGKCIAGKFCAKNGLIYGVYQRYYENGQIQWIEIRKRYQQNGIKIDFNYERTDKKYFNG